MCLCIRSSKNNEPVYTDDILHLRFIGDTYVKLGRQCAAADMLRNENNLWWRCKTNTVVGQITFV